MSDKKESRRELTRSEELVNSVTHGLGSGMSVIAILLLAKFALVKDFDQEYGFFIFGITLLFLYFSSTLYHSFSDPKAKRLFARLDHVSIFFLIAGTYTPFLLTIGNITSYIMLSVIWTLALAGAIIRFIYVTRFRKLMVLVYLVMGWMFVLAFNNFVRYLPSQSIQFLFIGGLLYSIGVVFYMWRKLPYGHGIWHLFVLGGSAAHFYAAFVLLEA